MEYDIIIIGGGPAGILAGKAAKQANPELKICLIKKDEGIPIRCSEPYVIGGYSALKEIVASDEMITGSGIDLVIDEVTQVSPDKKEVKTKKGNMYNYKKLVLATGASPFVPPIPGSNLRNVFTLRSPQDVENIGSALKESENISVVGGGAIGVELASVLKEKNKNITLIELLHHPLSRAYDEDYSKKAEELLKKSGVKVMTGKKLKEIKGDEKVESLILESGEEVKSELVILAMGVRSDVELAREAGIRIGKFGIETNKKQETSLEGVYACGDCAQAIEFITNKPVPSQLATTAVFQGRVAGINAAGGSAEYDGVVNPAVSVMFNKAIGRVGLTREVCEKEGFEVVTGEASSYTRYPCHPAAKEIDIKLIFDKKSKRLLGAQLFGGEEGISQRVNLLSLAIKNRLTIEQVASLDYCAHPELTPLPFAEPIVMAAEEALKKL